MGKYNFVYLTINNVNGKLYLGSHSTDNLQDGYLGSGIQMTRAIRKYGKENFTRIILEHTSAEDLRESENRWLVSIQPSKDPSWYNLKDVALGGNTRQSYTPEQKEEYIDKLRVSSSCVGKSGTDNHMFGKKHTRSFKEKRSMQQKEYFLKRKNEAGWEEQRLRMREAAKRNSLLGALKNKRPVVLQEGGATKQFSSRREAAAFIGCYPGNVASLLRRKEFQYKGRHFTYLD
jgi:group I intron endonuclease